MQFGIKIEISAPTLYIELQSKQLIVRPRKRLLWIVSVQQTYAIEPSWEPITLNALNYTYTENQMIIQDKLCV